MSFEQIAELRCDPGGAVVYEEGWQSWSPAGRYAATATPPRPRDRRERVMGWRAGKDLTASGFQGEGILGVETGERTSVWYARDPRREVPSIRCEVAGDRLLVSADGPVVELAGTGSLGEMLEALGDDLSPGAVRSIPPGWCSWSAYFGHLREPNVLENVDVAAALELPLEVVLVDDGYEPCVGDWLGENRRFGSLRRTTDRIRAAGKIAGVWTSPFLVGERSELAAAHPEWLVQDADAGWNWDQRLLVLDVTHPDAGAHLRETYATLAAWGVGLHKLDFLYAGALDGRRHDDRPPLEAYREGLRLVREGAGEDAILLGCGAPLLPSIGLVDAMRVGPDVLPEPRGEPPVAPQPDLDEVSARTAARAWTNGRLWVADPDSLVVRPGIAKREAWASYVQAYRGLTFSGDRLRELDERGIELTRSVLGA